MAEFDDARDPRDGEERESLASRIGESARVSEPPQFLPNAKGGLAFVPRRSVESGLLGTASAVSRMAGDTPLRLLTYLPDINPAFGFAVWNLLRLSCPVDGLRIVAVRPGAESHDDEDDEGTALIADLFDGLPRQVGGLNGLQTTLTLWTGLTGLPFLEAVPGARGAGVRRLWPVDSLTVRMNWEKVRGADGIEDWECVPHQLQRYAGTFGQPPGQNAPGSPRPKTNYVPLTGDRFFWAPLDTLPDDPYGRAPYCTALGEVLRDLALIQDLTDAVHNAAWPRLGFPFNFAETYKVAKEVYGIDDPAEAEKWVTDQFRAAQREANRIKAGSNVHYDAAGGLETIEGSKGFAALEPILVYLRQRITQACKTLPTMVGINDGATQTYTSVEWSLAAAGYEAIRAVPVALLVQAATLHLRLCGKALVAKAVYERIRTTDAQVEANVEATRIKNAIMKRDQGWITQDQASQEITGSDAVRPAPVYGRTGKGAQQGEGEGGAKPLPQGGTSDEEREAAEGAKQAAPHRFATAPNRLPAALGSSRTSYAYDGRFVTIRGRG